MTAEGIGGVPENLDWVATWAGGTPFAQLLGMRLDGLSGETARMSLPFRKESSNGDGALHGGVAASLIATSAGSLARAALGADSGAWHTAAIQVSYLSAALEEGLVAEARLLRKGKELAHIEVDVTSQTGKPIAKGLVAVRGRFGADRSPLPEPVTVADESETDPGPMGAFVASIPFHAALGLSVEHMAGGRSRITMPAQATTSDQQGVHEGALLALIDTTGAMAAWAQTGPGRYKASTPGMQARVLESQPSGAMVGRGWVVHRDRELLFCAVEICDARGRHLVADGTVNYRIVTPDLATRA